MSNILSAIVGMLWLLAFQRIVIPLPDVFATTQVMVALLVIIFVISIPSLPRHTQVLCGVLVVVVAVLAGVYDQWKAVPDGISRAAILRAPSPL